MGIFIELRKKKLKIGRAAACGRCNRGAAAPAQEPRSGHTSGALVGTPPATNAHVCHNRQPRLGHGRATSRGSPIVDTLSSRMNINAWIKNHSFEFTWCNLYNLYYLSIKKHEGIGGSISLLKSPIRKRTKMKTLLVQICCSKMNIYVII